MSSYMRAGGYTMWVLAALSLAMIVIAIRFLLKPEPARLAVLRSLSWAQVFVTLGGVATNFTMVCKAIVADYDQTHVFNSQMLMQGTGEALTPAGMGFSLLAFVWLVIALAVRKAHEPPT
ncbi:MAG TPA: hypothetical protein VHE35_25830 [Kofleriaceae bacterium]|nr:hypothetical protein [Kofleriaceae bacterium]